MKKKIIGALLIGICMAMVLNGVNASDMLNNIISQGKDFGSEAQNNMFASMNAIITGDITTAIGAIGNLIFAAITVILGAKYIWSSAEGKADVLENLPTFVIAVVLFYLGGSVYNLVSGVTSSMMSAASWTDLSNYIIYIINTIVKYVSFGGIVFIGIKYMMASAEGKASVKTSFGGAVLGLLLTFAATQVVTFIVTSAGYII